MSRTPCIWKPDYTITPKVTRLLMEIEKARTAVEHTPLSPAVEEELLRQARLRSTHYSTRIEGNRLTLAEVEQVILEATAEFPGRERDVRDVRNYWNALAQVEEWAQAKAPVTEDLIRRLHALVERGPRAKPTPYRDRQNVIRDSGSGAIVYLPPEAKDVPGLMAALVCWINEAEKAGVPTPLIAGLAHYQFATIHPYYDGNGRTARLLATLLLHRGGFGLHGYLSVEEHHAHDLNGYYQAVAVHPHHNYYEGRADADLTSRVEYFIVTLAEAFNAVRNEAKRLAEEDGLLEPPALRKLYGPARVVFNLFAHTNLITAPQIAQALGLSQRALRVLLRQWLADGWLVLVDLSRHRRGYEVAAIYRPYVGRLVNTTVEDGHRDTETQRK